VSELRWILAALGVLFVVGLFLWERRKQRPAARTLRAPDARDAADFDPGPLPLPEAPASTPWTASRSHDPSLLLPEIRARDPIAPLPVVEYTDEDDADEDQHPLEAQRAPPDLAVDADPGGPGGATGSADPIDSTCPRVPPDSVHSADRGDPAKSAHSADPADSASSTALPQDAAELRLDWPEEPERQIIAARVVPITERFGGRTVRQALAGEGFVHGPLGIFHRALPDGRVVLSCASLTKPGSFNLASMDSQRYAGLNLFGVLPGPVAGNSALEDLVTVSRTLASRLGGLVQDDRGQPLDATRVAELKATLAPVGSLALRPPGSAPVSGERAS
jgi:cell division protein ZipA